MNPRTGFGGSHIIFAEENQADMNPQRNCQDCGEVLHGRSDKKFCSDQCRNNYNNRLNSEASSLVRRINNILKRNYRILGELNPNGKANVSKLRLIEKGFNFSYFTSIYTNREGKTYYFCYDRGYLHIENDYCMLVVRDKNKKRETR